MAQHVITAGDAVVSRIDVAPALLHDPNLAERILPTGHVPQRIAIFAQPGSRHIANTAAAALERQGLSTATRVLPDRDAAKTVAVVEECYLWLNGLQLTRSDLIIAVGGGALTDVAGFVAATYLRGVAMVSIATTLLGAVDASIGGKTGINVGGKNLAGAFQHPVRVLIDTDELDSIERSLLREGSAEVVKAGFIGDPVIVDLYEQHGLNAPMDEIVDRAVAVKAGIVSQDFREAGIRGWLNYGHTVGHAVEIAAGVSHGEAVAIGMIAAGAASRDAVGFDGEVRQRGVIEKLGLPTSAPGLDPTQIRSLMALDKKRDRSGLRMTLLRSFSDPILAPVDDATVGSALRAVGIDAPR